MSDDSTTLYCMLFADVAVENSTLADRIFHALTANYAAMCLLRRRRQLSE